MARKIFRTLDEQIKILQNKGLIVRDVDKAKDILFRENYFFISGYRHLFMKKHHDQSFISGTTFEELYATFSFDRKLRNIMFKYILVIENNIKSVMSYQLSRKYGIREKEYLDPNNYTNDINRERQVRDILSKVKRQIRINGDKHTATLHYNNKYGYIPMWIVVKVLSFGIMSEFYNILKDEDKHAVAEAYSINPDILGIYLALLANYRNVCAHEDILYDYRTQRGIPDTRFHQYLEIEKDITDEFKYGKRDLFSLVIMMKEVLTAADFVEMFNELTYEIEILDAKVATVSTSAILNKLGFPNNWDAIKNHN